MTAWGDLDRARIDALHASELERFRASRPRSLALIERARAHLPNGVPMAWMVSDNDQPVYIDHGQGPGFTDIDGFGYVDFNASDMAMFGGHANPAIVRAVQAQAARSTQFLLPTEPSVAVAEELARRYPVPQWQFTLSATQANTEAIRLARAVTGREVIVLFEGHYHGHFEPSSLTGSRRPSGAAGLPWTAIRFGPRSGQWYGPVGRTGSDAHLLTDDRLTRLIRIWLANRGVWEALPGAGPTVPVPATRADVTRYLDAYRELLTALVA